jgi:hypothetical protein
MNRISLKPIARDYVHEAKDWKLNRGQKVNGVERVLRPCAATFRAVSRGPAAATTMMTRALEVSARPCVDLSAACASDFVVLMMWTVIGSMPPA